jgi:LysR family hydrogen peroxide-inducible transcriptional activator
MTLQQFEYIVAVDEHRHFVRAAESCGVTQSTLSSLIQKLESELDVVIFDRSCHPIEPTALGREIIAQARVVLYNASQMEELVSAHKELGVGNISLGVASTIAPFILPQLFRYMKQHHPDVVIHVEEARVETLKAKLQRAELDVAILAMPVAEDNLLEIPIFRERYVAYVSPDSDLYAHDVLDTQLLRADDIWVLGESYCPNIEQFPFCVRDISSVSIYAAGSIETLMRIVDENGGYTIVPELQLSLMDDAERRNIRELHNPVPGREVAFVVRRDFVRQRMLNILADALKTIIPEEMIDERLKKFAIKL